MSSSLLIPCYNAADTLPRLWETVNHQELKFDEVICYDDASTDSTADVARQLGATVISGGANVGPAQARNALWQAARGDWVHFHDADDLMLPQFLSTMVAAAQSKEADVLVCDVDWLDEETRKTILSYRYVESEAQSDPLSYVLEHPIGGINGFYRREALAAVDGFDSQLRNWEDADLHVRLVAAGRRFSFVEKVLCIALRSTGSVSMDYRRNWQYRIAALHNYEKSLPVGARPALAREAERAALSLAPLADPAGVRRAVQLAIRLGASPPSTANPLLRFAKNLVPAWWLVILQARLRHRH